MAMRYTIGSGVRCADGECGSVKRVVIDPVARQVTHLVVDPGRGAADRLVPTALVDAEAEGIKLTCGLDAFEGMERAEEGQFLPGGDDDDFGYEPAQTLLWPYFGPGLALAGPLNAAALAGSAGRPETRERVPAGEVQIRRGEPVEATDGQGGRVHGLLVAHDQTVTHVLLNEGHLWGKKTIAVPIADVERVGATIRVAYTKDQLKDFPGIDLSTTE
jgi:sporulation protein YlmC with PRC-barrel domain